ncbi:unnamed protein product [Pieris macdunnoughi]|uniref:Reverse transcriptase domain-containing protein n=1 Tax=Pieris macdunnoughi TaxID=345717 RepID=A0A821VJQ0_9NEOP|nr:unnamed protein product [Pieris macdunnoughi]
MASQPKSLNVLKVRFFDNLTSCLNELLRDGKFPDNLKIAKVSPIYKSGPRDDPGNYRPISVLPVMSKILERVVYTRLLDHLNNINFLYEHQYGFRSKSNTLSATINLITKIKTNTDQRKIVLVVFIDIMKAFDTVCHSLLVEKLETIGITGNALKMFKSYLKQ